MYPISEAHVKLNLSINQRILPVFSSICSASWYGHSFDHAEQAHAAFDHVKCSSRVPEHLLTYSSIDSTWSELMHYRFSSKQKSKLRRQEFFVSGVWRSKSYVKVDYLTKRKLFWQVRSLFQGTFAHSISKVNVVRETAWILGKTLTFASLYEVCAKVSQEHMKRLSWRGVW